MKRLLYGLAALGLLVGGAGEAKADYIFTILDGSESANGINDAVQIVGTSANGGFLYSGGRYTPVNVPTPPRALAATSPQGINNAGQVVGYFVEDNYTGFLLSGGNYNLFRVPGSLYTFGYGINSSGQVVGCYQASEFSQARGFLLDGGSYTRIDLPNSSYTAAYGINDHGHIVGTYGDNGLRGFLLSGGTYTMINVPGSVSTSVFGINHNDVIVGSYQRSYVGPDNYDHGFVAIDGNYITIDVPGALSTAVFGINDEGQIVGNFLDANQNSSPLPCPNHPLAIGTLGVIGWAWRRRVRALPPRHLHSLVEPLLSVTRYRQTVPYK